MMEVSFKGIRAALPSSEVTSIKAEWLSALSCWEVYDWAEDPAHLQEDKLREKHMNNNNTVQTERRRTGPNCIYKGR